MKKFLLFTVVILVIPILIVGLDKTEEIINKIKYGSYSNKVIRVKKTKTGEIVAVPIEEYIIGVVAGEVPASFDTEALKAQAVASRTYALKRALNNKEEFDVTDDTQNQVYITYEEMKKKWQNNYEKYLLKIKDAVISTKSEVILYDNNLIDALFFSTSNGYTENSKDVFSGDLPYLKSVESSWDKTESPTFSSITQVSKSEFLFNLGLQQTNDIYITNIKKTNTGRVISLTINGKEISSNTVRSVFNLKSTSFSINIEKEKVIFNVSGYGHGVGMSQYGANGMAKEGYKYQDILKHYYQNCEIKKIN